MSVSILMLHNRYNVRGGEDESTDAEVALLRSKGHRVELVEVDNSISESASGQLRSAVRATWSTLGTEIIRRRAADGEYDILHAQNLFPQLSPSVYYEARKHGMAVVQAVRNYRLVCASANLFRDGAFCDACVGKILPLPALRYRCYRESLGGTAAVAAMQTLHWGLRTWSTKVDRYVALTNYVRAQLVNGGFPAERIVVKPNFVPPSAVQRYRGDGKPYAIYVGRLTADKGVDWLLENWARQSTNIELMLIGVGEIAAKYLSGNETGTCKVGEATIHFTGRLTLNQTYQAIAGAEFLIQPAVWPEPFGRVVIEAYSLGVPVLAARVGGMQELIEHGVTGLTYAPNDALEFGRALAQLSEPSVRHSMASAAAQRYEQLYTPDVNYKFLMDIYLEAINSRKQGA